MPIVRIFLILLALASPALAQDGARNAAAAREAAQAFRGYVEGVAKKGGRPDLTRPDVAALLGHIYDLDALNALPPAQASDIEWLLDWVDAANTASKLFTRYGSKQESQPDFTALARNMAAYEDQYAAALNFMIRAPGPRGGLDEIVHGGPRAGAAHARARRGLARARNGAAEFVLAAICSAIQGGSKAVNARLVAAAIRDTREVWASYFLPQDRARMIDCSPTFPSGCRMRRREPISPPSRPRFKPEYLTFSACASNGVQSLFRSDGIGTGLYLFV